jgi:hypothetical protein
MRSCGLTTVGPVLTSDPHIGLPLTIVDIDYAAVELRIARRLGLSMGDTIEGERSGRYRN